jgi:hypothetical protein
MGTTNITLSVDEATVERAREVARHQGKSLNALIREFIERVAGRSTGEEVARELERLWAEGRGKSRDGKFDRDEIYEDRLGRSRVR